MSDGIKALPTVVEKVHPILQTSPAHGAQGPPCHARAGFPFLAFFRRRTAFVTGPFFLSGFFLAFTRATRSSTRSFWVAAKTASPR